MSGQIRAVIFDLDGVLVDSEEVWDAARRQLTQDSGGRWSESATQDMMGMSSIEWSRNMHEELGVKMPPEEISAAVVERMEELYREHLPLIPGAREAVEDRKSTRLNSSHANISYAVFCLKKKNIQI